MKLAVRFLALILFPVSSLAMTLLWVRSAWTVDKIWMQVLPHGMVDLQLSPGQLMIGYSASNVSLPVGESGWSTWHADSYYGDYILWPADTVFGELGFLDGGLAIPFWFLVLLAAAISLTAYAWRPTTEKAIVAKPNESTASSKALPPLPSGSLTRQRGTWQLRGSIT